MLPCSASGPKEQFNPVLAQNSTLGLTGLLAQMQSMAALNGVTLQHHCSGGRWKEASHRGLLSVQPCQPNSARPTWPKNIPQGPTALAPPAHELSQVWCAIQLQQARQNAQQDLTVGKGSVGLVGGNPKMLPQILLHCQSINQSINLQSLSLGIIRESTDNDWRISEHAESEWYCGSEPSAELSEPSAEQALSVSPVSLKK